MYMLVLSELEDVGLQVVKIDYEKINSKTFKIGEPKRNHLEKTNVLGVEAMNKIINRDISADSIQKNFWFYDSLHGSELVSTPVIYVLKNDKSKGLELLLNFQLLQVEKQRKKLNLKEKSIINICEEMARRDETA